MRKIPYLTASIVIALDQLVKWLVLSVLHMPLRPPIEVLPFFNLVMVWNHGVSFGMFAHVDARWPLTMLAVAVSFALLRWHGCMVKRAHPRLLPYAIATGLIVGGAMGNVIDRLRFGAVADFLDVHIAGYHWPSFNVADACICTGVMLLLWCEFRYGKMEKQDS